MCTRGAVARERSRLSVSDTLALARPNTESKVKRTLQAIFRELGGGRVRVQRGRCGGRALTRSDLLDRAHARGYVSSAGEAASCVACSLRSLRAGSSGAVLPWPLWFLLRRGVGTTSSSVLPRKRWAGATASQHVASVRGDRRGRRLCLRVCRLCRALFAQTASL